MDLITMPRKSGYAVTYGRILDPDCVVTGHWYELASILRLGNWTKLVSISLKSWYTVVGSDIPDSNCIIV
jgi:hypothetical protein